jgi:hypothetical protein
MLVIALAITGQGVRVRGRHNAVSHRTVITEVKALPPLGVEVSNSAEFQLQLLLSRVQQLSDEHWHILEQSRRVMADHAWVGPSARSFGRDLDTENRALQDQLRKSVELVRQQLLSARGGPWLMSG